MTWTFAVAPVVLLFVVVLAGRLTTYVAAALVLVTSVGIGAVGFRADVGVLVVALGKGTWLGIWILGVVWPALLMYRVASAAGLERIGGVFATLLPQRRETLLLLAWVFPSFLQGVAGFGTPIAVCAPLLVAAGWSAKRAVFYPLIGYHWSVTFGSMGSSFYMAALTANLGSTQQQDFAFLASSALAIHCLVAGVLVLWLDGGFAAVREGWRMVAFVGIPMATTLIGVAVTVPAVASLSAGTAGFLAVLGMAAMTRRRLKASALAGAGGDSETGPPTTKNLSVGRSLQALAPYLVLLITALPVFLVPSSRLWVQNNLVIAPNFPATQTGYGWTNPFVADYTPIALLGHPGFYVALASLLGYLTYRAAGMWPHDRVGVIGAWARSLPKSSMSIVLLAALATVMADTGMVAVLATGVADFTGEVFPALSPVIGGIGSFMTGSTTTSNALFAGLQKDVAVLLRIEPATLLAAQTVGGNVGNALAPVVALIGLTTVNAEQDLALVFRRCLAPAAVLLATIATITLLRV